MTVSVLGVPVPGWLLFLAFIAVLIVASAVLFRYGGGRGPTRR